MSLNEIAVNAVWAAPFIGTAIVLFLSLLLHKNKFRNLISVGSLFVSAIFSTLLLILVLQSSSGVIQFTTPWIPSIGVNFLLYIDTLAAFMAVLVSWLCFLISVYSVKYMEGDSGLSRYWLFFTFFTGCMLLIVMSGNLLLTFIGWEGTGFASYALIGHWFTDQKKDWVGDPGRKALGAPMEFSPSTSGVRALIFTRIGDVGFIAGIALIYALTHSLSIPAMSANAAAWGTKMALRGILLPFLLFFSLGAFAKSAQFPFHEWLVTAMTGPSPVSALIHAATMVKAGVFFMLRFMPIFFIVLQVLLAVMPASASNVTIFFTVTLYIGAFTAFFMATQAVVAKELKLILAFSTASQLGFMFAAIGAAGLIPNFTAGFIACFNQLLSHAIFKAALFLAAGAVIHAVGSRFITDMGGLSKYMKYTFIAMLISALSLAGLPPLLGFWTKDSVMGSVFQTGLFIPIALLFSTVAITAFYSARMVFRTFQTQPSQNVTKLVENGKLHKTSKTMLIPYFILALATLVLGLFWVFIGGDFYSALTRSVLGLVRNPAALQVTLDPLTTGLSLALVALGLGLAYLLYGKPNYQVRMAQQLSVNSRLKALQNFLYDRWYIQAVYYKVFVNGGSKLYQGMFKFFETGGIDRFYNEATVNAAMKLSNAFRKIQSGKINYYLLYLVIGFVILLIIFLWGIL